MEQKLRSLLCYSFPKERGWFVADSEFQIVRSQQFKKIPRSFPIKHPRGRAFFHRIKDGEYQLEFFRGDEPLETIELSIFITKNE